MYMKFYNNNFFVRVSTLICLCIWERNLQKVNFFG